MADTKPKDRTTRRPDCVTEIRMGNSVLVVSGFFKENSTFFKAVYDGHRDFAAIAVCGGKDGVITGAFPPCGVCRQVMLEFCGDDFLIYMITPEGCEAHTLAEILPFSFSAQKHMHA